MNRMMLPSVTGYEKKEKMVSLRFNPRGLIKFFSISTTKIDGLMFVLGTIPLGVLKVGLSDSKMY